MGEFKKAVLATRVYLAARKNFFKASRVSRKHIFLKIVPADPGELICRFLFKQFYRWKVKTQAFP